MKVILAGPLIAIGLFAAVPASAQRLECWPGRSRCRLAVERSARA